MKENTLKQTWSEGQKIRAFRLALMLVFVLAITLIPLNTSYGVTACPSLVSFQQPDGTLISYHVRGDERVNWKETKDGALILLDNRTGYYCYAKKLLGHVYKSSAKVGIDKKPMFAAAGTKNNATQYMEATATPGKVSTSGSAFGSTTYNASALLTPMSPPATQPVLVLIINFTNVSSNAPAGFWSDSFFSATKSSVNKYFNEVSYGATSIVPVSENAQTANDGVIRVTLPQDHPAVLGYTTDINDQVPLLVRDALDKADDYMDFSAYDTNSDGVISTDELHISAIFAGGEAAVGGIYNSIWAHSWEFAPLTVDGKTVRHYIAVGENFADNNGNPMLSPMTIGVFCHELVHSMGLPDLYDYGYDSIGVGGMSLMGEGSWGSNGMPGSSPVQLDAWSKIELGFATPIDATNGSEYTLNEASLSNYNILKVSDPSNPDQYFLLENRGSSGYDYGLKDFFRNRGVVIYHIDEEVMRYAASHPDTFPYFNDNRFRKAVDVEEANQSVAQFQELNYYGDNRYVYVNPLPQTYRGYTFFAAGDATRYNSIFSDATTPSAKYYSNTVNATIIPPLIYDAPTNQEWYFETDSAIGNQNDASGFALEVVDSSMQNMRVRYNIQSFSISLTTSPLAAGSVSGGGRLVKDSTATLLATANPGYKFSFWSENGSLLSSANPYVTQVTRSMSLTAVFTPNYYTIKFDGNGGTGSMSEMAMVYGGYQYLTANSFAKPGYVFDGWYRTAGGTQAYRDKEGVSNLTPVDGGVVTLYARWKLVDYPVYYNLNGGKNSLSNPLKYNILSSDLALSPPTKPGYVFKGWYTSSTFTGLPVVQIPAGSFGNKTFYAKWEAPVFVVGSYNYTTVKVTWAGVANATSYKIYRATSSTGTYSLVNTAASTARSWLDSGRVTGKYYYYKIYPVIGGQTIAIGTIKYSRPIPAPPSLGVVKVSASSIKLTWSGVSGATKYLIYRADSATGSYVFKYTASSASRSWTNTGLIHGKTYYYKVRAYHLEGTVIVYGYYSTARYLPM